MGPCVSTGKTQKQPFRLENRTFDRLLKCRTTSSNDFDSIETRSLIRFRSSKSNDNRNNNNNLSVKSNNFDRTNISSMNRRRSRASFIPAPIVPGIEHARANGSKRILSFSSIVFNQETQINDENCSLKSLDLLCQCEETSSLNSISQSELTDSFNQEISPRLENHFSEPLTIDTEAYRQLMKDVTILKTILHQLDRLLKQNENPSPLQTSTNSTEDDLLKEILFLRKQHERDKETIDSLRDKLCKYSSQ